MEEHGAVPVILLAVVILLLLWLAVKAAKKHRQRLRDEEACRIALRLLQQIKCDEDGTKTRTRYVICAKCEICSTR